MTEEQLNKILDGQFAKFYGLIDRRLNEMRDELRSEIVVVRDRVDSLHGAVDTLSGHVQDAVTDNLARDAQLERHDQAITQLADQARVKLQYE